MDGTTTADGPPRRRTQRSWRSWRPVAMVQAAHPRLGLLSALGLAGGAALSGRPTREVAMVLATALVGQAVLGWHNDLVDRERDTAHDRQDKPLAQGRLDPGSLWFWLAVGVLLVVPLAVFHGLWAAGAYLGALVLGLVGNVVLRRGMFSWLTWAASYALYPAFLAYGGWGGVGREAPPEVSMTVLAALLGVCVHVLAALPGLVADNEDGLRHLPLRLALRIGAPRLLWVTLVATALVLAALLATGARVGLTQ